MFLKDPEKKGNLNDLLNGFKQILSINHAHG